MLKGFCNFADWQMYKTIMPFFIIIGITVKQK